MDRAGHSGRFLYRKEIGYADPQKGSNRVELIYRGAVLGVVKPLRDGPLAFQAHGSHECASLASVSDGLFYAIPE